MSHDVVQLIFVPSERERSQPDDEVDDDDAMETADETADEGTLLAEKASANTATAALSPSLAPAHTR